MAFGNDVYIVERVYKCLNTMQIIHAVNAYFENLDADREAIPVLAI